MFRKRQLCACCPIPSKSQRRQEETASIRKGKKIKDHSAKSYENRTNFRAGRPKRIPSCDRIYRLFIYLLIYFLVCCRAHNNVSSWFISALRCLPAPAVGTQSHISRHLWTRVFAASATASEEIKPGGKKKMKEKKLSESKRRFRNRSIERQRTSQEVLFRGDWANAAEKKKKLGSLTCSMFSQSIWVTAPVFSCN